MLLLVLQHQDWITVRLSTLFNGVPEQVEPAALDLVAIVQLNVEKENLGLELAWQVTQNDCPQLDPNPICWKAACRSTDVGDVIQLGDGRAFAVAGDGFKPLAQPPLIHVGQSLMAPNGELLEIFPSLPFADWQRDLVLEVTEHGWYYLESCQHEVISYQRLCSHK